MSALKPTPLAQLSELLNDLIHRANENRIAVDMQEATRLLGLKDIKVTRRLIQSGDLRARRPRGSNKTLISVQSLHEYIGDNK